MRLGGLAVIISHVARLSSVPATSFFFSAQRHEQKRKVDFVQANSHVKRADAGQETRHVDHVGQRHEGQIWGMWGD